MYRQAEDIMEITNKVQRLTGQICSELSGAIVSLDPEIPFKGTKSAIHFMAPRENASDIELCEIGYEFVDANDEVRRRFITGGAGNFQYPTSKVIYEDDNWGAYIDKVESLIFRYKGDSGNWEDEDSGWDSELHDDKLPQMIEIEIIMNDNRSVAYTFTTRIFLPGSTDNP